MQEGSTLGSHIPGRFPLKGTMVKNFQGCHDAPLPADFMKVSSTFPRYKDALFWTSYWAKIKFNITGNILSFSIMQHSLASFWQCQFSVIRQAVTISLVDVMLIFYYTSMI